MPPRLAYFEVGVFAPVHGAAGRFGECWGILIADHGSALLTLLAQSATDVLDEVVALFDQAISAKFSTAEKRMRDELAERGKAGEDRQALLDDLLSIITDLQILDEEIGGLIRGERIGWERLRAAIVQAKPRLPRDHGHLAALDASYSYLRQYTPVVLSSVRFASGTATTELLIAVNMLGEFGIHESDGAPDEKEGRPKREPPGYQACMMAR